MLVIGLTGGIGSGKSTVTKLINALGVPIIDMDTIAHALVEPGQPALAEIIQAFGEDILLSDGQLDRARLRQEIFSSTAQRRQLETILHPRIRQEVRERLQNLQAAYCIVVIPLLIETGQQDLVDRILVIDAPVETQIQRCMSRDGISEQAVHEILATQVDRNVRLAAADDVITNNADLRQLEQDVALLHRKYLELATKKPG